MPNGDQQPKVASWDQISKNFDPMMPAQLYDGLRFKYFQDYVAPRVPRGKSVDATWQAFKNLTERPELLTAKSKHELHLQTAGVAAAIGVMSPLKDLDPASSRKFEELQARALDLNRMAAREGMNTKPAEIMGSMAGQAIDFTILGEALGPIAGALAGEMATSARAVDITGKILRGGLSFGTYDALSADQGNRLMAGLKGFGIGAAFDLGLSAPGYLVSRRLAKSAREAEELLRRANAGELGMRGTPADKQVDQAISEKVKADAETGRLELRPERTHWEYTLGQRGARVHTRDISGQPVAFDIRTGREYDAYRQVRQVVEQGGSVTHYELHPDDSRQLNEFVRIQTEAEEAKYRGTVIRTPTGQAEAVAEAAKSEGLPAQAVSRNAVEVATVPIEHPVLNRPQEASVPRMPERRPSDVEVAQVLEKRPGMSNKNKEFIRYHFDKVWNQDLEYEDKRTSLAILGRHAPELLPEQWRAKMPPLDPQGNLIKEIAQAKVDEAAERTLGRRPTISSIKKGSKGQTVVTVGGMLNEVERGKWQEALGPGFELQVAKGVTEGRPVGARVRSDEETMEILSFHNVKPEDVDFEAVRQGGEAELIRQLEVRKPELYGRRTAVPKAAGSPILDHIPPSEQDPIRALPSGKLRNLSGDHSLLQGAMDAGGQQHFLATPAGLKSAMQQVTDASLQGRILGSVEDVSQDELFPVGIELADKGFRVLPIRGYEQGKYEVMYFRRVDMERVAPVIKDYDQYISKQAGRHFDSDGNPVREVGQVAHDRMAKAFGVPPEEWAPHADIEGRVGGVRPAREVDIKPYGNRLVLQKEDLQRLYPGGAGFAVPSWHEFVKNLGIELPPSLKGADKMIVLTPESTRNVIWHERLHANGMHAGTYEDFHRFIEAGDKQTAIELGSGLVDSFKGYAAYSATQSYEEAFTHAAEALRFNDKPYLERLAAWDRDIHHVIDFVGNTANNLLEHTFSSSMDTVPVRIYQRTLWDLMRRASPEISETLRDSVRITSSGMSSWYDAGKDVWIMRDSPTSERQFKDINELWDHILANDKNFMAPSASFRPELGGVRGPIAPVGREPNGAPLPLPEIPPEGPYAGMSAASALWRPFFPWLATLHEKLNVAFRKSGSYLPLYETAKAVDDQFRAGDEWLQKTYETVADLLKPFKGKKQNSVFDYLTHPEAERTTNLMQKYGLTQPEALQAHKVWEFMKEFRQQTGINLPQYMLEFHPKLRAFSWAPERVFGPQTAPNVRPRTSAEFFDRMIRQDGKWDPQDAHLGRFLHVMMREGMEQKFTGKSLDALDKMLERKTNDGAYVIPNSVRWPITNYARYMRGIPDTSQQVMNRVMGDFFTRINDKIKALNTKLPGSAQLPTMTAPPRQVLQRFMLMSYAMGLGLRPAIAVRDMMQAFTGGMVVMGPGRFTKAFTNFVMNWGKSFEVADKAGALLRKNNVGELHGDIMGEVPTSGPGWMDRITKWSNALLAPSRWGHNFGRAIMFTGEYNDALEAVKAYRSGARTIDQLATDTSLWFMDKPAQTRLLQYVSNNSVPAEDAATKIALEAVDLTQWPYRRGTQPTLLRYGVGRIFGQYGVWPANYADFLYRIGKKWGERPDMAARTSAMWVATQFAASGAFNAIGADTSRWFWQSPAGFAGSPHWDFIHALMVAPENTEEGHAARRTILEYPLNFVPALSEMKSVAKAIEAGGANNDQESLLRALGFTPAKNPTAEQDWQDFIETQMGYKGARRRR